MVRVPSPVASDKPAVVAGTLSYTVPLPADFRAEDMLAFHRRDTQAVAEQVDESGLSKGIAWHGRPARLSVRFENSEARAELHVDAADKLGAKDVTEFEALVRRLLGLTQPVEIFEAQYREHRYVGRLIAAHPGLRVALCATPFEALTWAVTAQQISLSAALSLRRRLIQTAALRHDSGLYCYPDASTLANLGTQALHAVGFSQAKADTVIALSKHVAAAHLPMDTWMETMPIEEIQSQLLAIRGIGPWTLNYTLLRGFGYLDGSLHGDVAVRRKLQVLLGGEERLSERYTENWLAEFTPWRALVAAHLWAMPMAGVGFQG